MQNRFTCGKPHLHFQYLYGCTGFTKYLPLSNTIRKKSRKTDLGTAFVKETGACLASIR